MAFASAFDPKEIDDLLLASDDDAANTVPPVPENPVSRPVDLWLCGDGRSQHRVLCADATSAEAVARLLGERKPTLMVTDPPYGIELDSEWRDRAGLNTAPGQKRTAASKAAAKANPQYAAEPSYMKHRTEGHTETTISGDTRADWSEAFELVPSLQVAYVWHASKFTREVLNGLAPELGIGMFEVSGKRFGSLHRRQVIQQAADPPEGRHFDRIKPFFVEHDRRHARVIERFEQERKRPCAGIK